MENSSHKHQLIIVGLVALAIVLWLMMRGGKSVTDIVKQVSSGFSLPNIGDPFNVGGYNIDAGSSTYNIPGLKINKGCGQSACSFNIMPQLPNRSGSSNNSNGGNSGGVGIGVQANPAGDLARAIAAGETQGQLDQNMIIATYISNPPLYPWAVDRFY